MPQVVYETNLDLTLTEEKITTFESRGGPEYSKKGILRFYLDDDNIKEIQITPTGKVMVFCKSVDALNEKLPLIRSLTVSEDGSEADWRLSKIVQSPLARFGSVKSRLGKIKPRWIITAYNYIITKGGLRAELEVPELEHISRLGTALGDEERKILQIQGNLEISEKLRKAAEEELKRMKKKKRKGNVTS